MREKEMEVSKNSTPLLVEVSWREPFPQGAAYSASVRVQAGALGKWSLGEAEGTGLRAQ